jgi:hypothetical protein
MQLHGTLRGEAARQARIMRGDMNSACLSTQQYVLLSVMGRAGNMQLLLRHCHSPPISCSFICSLPQVRPGGRDVAWMRSPRCVFPFAPATPLVSCNATKDRTSRLTPATARGFLEFKLRRLRLLCSPVWSFLCARRYVVVQARLAAFFLWKYRLRDFPFRKSMTCKEDAVSLLHHARGWFPGARWTALMASAVKTVGKNSFRIDTS